MKKTLIPLICCLISLTASAQIGELKLNGYVQSDFALIQQDGKGYVGDAYSQKQDGNADWFFRYGVRRGLLRATFTSNKGKGVLEASLSETGLLPLVAYLELDPWQWLEIQAGLLNLDFGWELCYPSSKLETLERSMHTQSLFPKEHDLGLKFAFRPKPLSEHSNLYLSVALMSGNGINKFVDKLPNLMAHLKYEYKTPTLCLALGTSYYEGKTNNADSVIYTVENGDWQAEITDFNTKNPRRYIDFELSAEFFYDFGSSTLRSEYIFGVQPSRKSSFNSQGLGIYDSYDQNNAFSYQRNFNGAYVYYIQSFNRCPISLVGRFAWLNKNTDIKENDKKTLSDATYTNIGGGIIYKYNQHISAELFYDAYFNTQNTYLSDQNDDMLHLRLQYIF
ncbi:MAG: hypothetical protein HUK18_03030 [Bacteroidales bacterium]|nr:hypothetical protein [Bacteroidales bacterium]